MLRFLYLTDTHLRGTAPAARKDDFAASVKAKLAEVVELAETLNAAAVVHGGDLFDLPEPGVGQVGEYLEILSKLHVPLFVVPGNHDVYGHNPSTLPRTILGLLARVGVVQILGREPVIIEGGGVRVRLTGQGFHPEMDRRGPAEDYAVPPSAADGCDYAVHVVHGMLLPRAEISSAPFLPAATAAEDVLAVTGADYTLAGHYHSPWEMHVDGRTAANPGALVRVTSEARELARRPQVMVIEACRDGIRHRYIPLSSARPGEEVLDAARLDADRAREEARAEFLASLEAFGGGSHGIDPEEVLRETMARMDVGAEVEAEVWRRFQEARAGI
jgi:DNA repair exonuclease SbcCD nuclease subunit